MENELGDWVMDKSGNFHAKSGFKYITSTPDKKAITGMVNFNGQIIVCSTDHIYKLKDDKLEEVRIERN